MASEGTLIAILYVLQNALFGCCCLSGIETVKVLAAPTPLG